MVEEQGAKVTGSPGGAVRPTSLRTRIKRLLSQPREQNAPKPSPRLPPVTLELSEDNTIDDSEFRGRSPRQDKNRRRSRSRSIARGVSQVMAGIVAGSIAGWSPVDRRPSSRSISRARPITIDESILLYEKSRANASIQLRLNRLLAGCYGDVPAWYLRISISIARGRLEIKDAIFRLKFRCPDCSDVLWGIKKYSPLKLLGRGTDVNYVDTRSTEVGAQVGRDEIKGETKVSYGKERSYVQENCYALELAETNNTLQAHLWRVGDANTVTPPSRFSLQVVVEAPCRCDQMEITADLDVNRGSENAHGSWRPVPLPKGAPGVLNELDFAKWSKEEWMLNDSSELFEARCVHILKILLALCGLL